MKIELSRDEDTSGHVNIHCIDGDVQVHKFIFKRISTLTEHEINVGCEVFPVTYITDIYYCIDLYGKYKNKITASNMSNIVDCLDTLQVIPIIRTEIVKNILSYLTPYSGYVLGINKLLPYATGKQHNMLIRMLDPESIKTIIADLHAKVVSSGMSLTRRHGTKDMYNVTKVLRKIYWQTWTNEQILDFYNTIPQILHYANYVRDKNDFIDKILSLVPQNVLHDCFNFYFKVVVTDPNPPYFLWIFGAIKKYIEVDQKTQSIISRLATMDHGIYDYYVDL